MMLSFQQFYRYSRKTGEITPNAVPFRAIFWCYCAIYDVRKRHAFIDRPTDPWKLPALIVKNRRPLSSLVGGPLSHFEQHVRTARPTCTPARTAHYTTQALIMNVENRPRSGLRTRNAEINASISLLKRRNRAWMPTLAAKRSQLSTTYLSSDCLSCPEKRARTPPRHAH